MKKIFRKIVVGYFSTFAYFYKVLRFRVFITFFLSLMVGVLDGFGLAMFMPLLQAASGEGNVEASNLGNLSFLVNALTAFGVGLNIFSILTVILIFFFIKGLIKFLEGYVNTVYQQYFIKNIRVKLIKGISNLSYEAFIKNDTGEILNTVSGEVEKVNQAFRAYFLSVQAMVLVIVYIGLAFLTNAQFAIFITIGGAISNLLFKNLYKHTKKLSRKGVKLAHHYQSVVLQQVSGFKYLKASGLMNQYSRKVNELIDSLKLNYIKIGRLKALVQAIREPVTIFVVVLVIVIQVHFFDVHISLIILSLLFFYRAMSYLMSLQLNWNNFLTHTGSLDNMQDFNEVLSRNYEKYGEIKFQSLQDSIRLENVSFSYGAKKVLDNVSLEIKKNQMIAFVGESGSGKTTLVNVIAGLLKPTSGQIIVDNKSSYELDMPSYRNRLGYITQEPVIFGDTVFNNVTFWDESNDSNLSKFKNVIEKVRLKKFIEGLKDGENTQLGANGFDLSGGQRQRLVIARELYKDIDVLIMDEATSSLDSQTENEIQSNVDSLKGSVTLISIAHRLSTIKNADVIFLMGDGGVIQSGSFSELMNSSVKFRKMIELQALE